MWEAFSMQIKMCQKHLCIFNPCVIWFLFSTLNLSQRPIACFILGWRLLALIANFPYLTNL